MAEPTRVNDIDGVWTVDHLVTAAPIRVIVRFDDGVPDDIQAKCLFDFEIALRTMSGMDVRVLKDRMADDSKLRVVMDLRRSKKK